MKINVKGWVHHRKYDWQDEGHYLLFPFEIADADTVPICETEFEAEIPDGFDPLPVKIEILRKEKQRIQAEAHVKAENIERQIQELLCIESKVPA